MIDYRELTALATAAAVDASAPCHLICD